MSEDTRPSITTQAIAREVDPTTGLYNVKVRFTIREVDGTTSEWSIWIQREDNLARAEELARKEIHRISALLVAKDEAAPAGRAAASQTDHSAKERARESQRARGARLAQKLARMGGTRSGE